MNVGFDLFKPGALGAMLKNDGALFPPFRLVIYRGGEKGPQGSGTKTVSICVAWTHRGLERYPDVFSCFRRSEKHPQTSVLDPKWIFWSRNSRLPNLDISRDHRRYIIYIISKIPADTTHIFLSSMNLLTQEMLTLLGIILRR